LKFKLRIIREKELERTIVFWVSPLVTPLFILCPVFFGWKPFTNTVKEYYLHSEYMTKFAGRCKRTKRRKGRSNEQVAEKNLERDLSRMKNDYEIESLMN